MTDQESPANEQSTPAQGTSRSEQFEKARQESFTESRKQPDGLPPPAFVASGEPIGGEPPPADIPVPPAVTPTATQATQDDI
jgi:hypothetical protein